MKNQYRYHSSRQTELLLQEQAVALPTVALATLTRIVLTEMKRRAFSALAVGGHY